MLTKLVVKHESLYSGGIENGYPICVRNFESHSPSQHTLEANLECINFRTFSIENLELHFTDMAHICGQLLSNGT